MEKCKATREANQHLKEHVVYVLQNSYNLKCYIGITNDPHKRLRQHNGLARGGAWMTRIFK